MRAGFVRRFTTSWSGRTPRFASATILNGRKMLCLPPAGPTCDFISGKMMGAIHRVSSKDGPSEFRSWLRRAPTSTPISTTMPGGTRWRMPVNCVPCLTRGRSRRHRVSAAWMTATTDKTFSEDRSDSFNCLPPPLNFITMKIFVGISGASGSIYGGRLLQALARTEHEITACISEGALEVVRYEERLDVDEAAGRDALVEAFLERHEIGAAGIQLADPRAMADVFASGSSLAGAAIICP